MKKAFLLVFILALACIALAACGGDDVKICFHEWQNVESEEMLKAEATCTSRAVYYSSCSVCGDKGTVFEAGEKLEHTFGNTVHKDYFVSAATCTEHAVYYQSCIYCGTAADTTFDAPGLADHDYGKHASKETLAEKATCLNPNTYYLSCDRCGAIGTHTFTLGPTLAHVDTHGDDICDECNKPLKVWDDVSTDKVTGKHEFTKD